MRWTEGHIHVAMRRFLQERDWVLIAGEFPGGSDHHLYPLNVVDPLVACDRSPDPRRHSTGELIPDLIALQNRALLVGEAKVRYDGGDLRKLTLLLSDRRAHLLSALRTFALERRFPDLLPIESLKFYPTLVFESHCVAPPPPAGFSYLRMVNKTEAYFEGALAGFVNE
jgi:hypothetical protein